VPRGNPLGAYGQVDRPAAKGKNDGDGRRNYDKPWLAPEKDVKDKPKTYAEFMYPDGIGPDTDLINMIEKDLLVENPNVNFDDIAELDETKKLL
jgi:katanin p60 ATPase-containing subunit A1